LTDSETVTKRNQKFPVQLLYGSDLFRWDVSDACM